jgi:pilus assembly protein Flp/PilA
MTKFVKLFAADESGATAIEYGLIAAGISVAIIGILGTMSTSIIATFQAVIDAMA